MSATPAPAFSVGAWAADAPVGSATRAAAISAVAARSLPPERILAWLLAAEEVDLGDRRLLLVLRQLGDPDEVVAPVVARRVEVDRDATALGVDVPDVAPEARHGRRHLVLGHVDLALPAL